MGLKIPPIGVAKDVVVYDYRINPELPDSLRTMSRVTVDSASTKVDSAFWVVHNVLPLTTEEDRAYQKLDSTQSLGKTIRTIRVLGHASHNNVNGTAQLS